MAVRFAIFMQKFNALMFCSSANRFGVTYQGKVGDDIEVRVDGLVERFVIFIITIINTEFKGRTVSYGPSFSSSIYGPSTKRAGHISKGKKRGSITYSTDQENEVSKIFIISLVCV